MRMLVMQIFVYNIRINTLIYSVSASILSATIYTDLKICFMHMTSSVFFSSLQPIFFLKFFYWTFKCYFCPIYKKKSNKRENKVPHRNFAFFFFWKHRLNSFQTSAIKRLCVNWKLKCSGWEGEWKQQMHSETVPLGEFSALTE